MVCFILVQSRPLHSWQGCHRGGILRGGCLKTPENKEKNNIAKRRLPLGLVPWQPLFQADPNRIKEGKSDRLYFVFQEMQDSGNVI